MSLRLQEISLLPLDQRAARIAQLFAAETHDEPSRDGRPSASYGAEMRARARTIRAMASWARPGRLALAVKAFAAFAARTLFSDSDAPHRAFRGAEGFFGFAPVPDAGDALEFYAQGLYFENFPGLASLWSPPWRAIVRPAEALRLPATVAGESKVRLDTDFERLLHLCEAQASGAGRRPAFPGVLSQLYAHGFAHALELCDSQGTEGAEGTQAVLIGVSSGGVFTIEACFARDRYTFARAVAELARHLASKDFTAIDFRAVSPHLHGLPIEMISRDKFVALLRESAEARPGRWRRKDVVQPKIQRAA